MTVRAAAAAGQRVEVLGVSGARGISARPWRRGVKLFLALAAMVASCASAPIEISPARPLHKCEYSNVGGRRFWEHINVVGNDGTYLTIEYPNRERETHGSRRGLMQQKRVLIDENTIGPCKENMFTPTAPPEEFRPDGRP